MLLHVKAVLAWAVLLFMAHSRLMVLWHRPQCWHTSLLLASPQPAKRCACHAAEGVRQASLWRMQPRGNAPLEQAAQLRGGDGGVRAVQWHPSQEDSALSVGDDGLRHWSVRGGNAEVSASLA